MRFLICALITLVLTSCEWGEASAPHGSSSGASVPGGLSGASAPSLLSGGKATCPEGCGCGVGDGEEEYSCVAGGAAFVVKALYNDYVRILCKSGDLDPSTMPQLPLSPNGTLSSVGLRDCSLPRTLASMLERLGARGARSVTLVNTRGELGEEFAVGMEEAEMLMITDAGNLTRVPWSLVDALPALKELRIRDANITLDEETGEEVAPPHPSLRLLELSLSRISSLPRGAFSRLHNVTSLHLYGNEIRNISADAFIGLDNVQSLDLSKNPLTLLPARALSPLRRLRRLTLVATSLARVHTDAFAGLHQLDQVLLKYNRGTVQFGARAFADLPALKSLAIVSCRLGPLPGDLLDGSKALEEINITSSFLAAIPESLFRSQGALRRLDLSGNRIRALGSSCFSSLKAMEVLNLDDNRIKELPSQLFSGLTKLLVFSADRNRLEVVAEDALQGAVGLRRASLADNRLTLEPQLSGMPDYWDLGLPSPFAKLQQLREVILSGNRITKMFSDWHFQLIHELRLLDLSRNNFTELMQADMQFLGSNVTIDLRHNRISAIELMPPLPGLPEPPDNGNVMLLDDNPFSCSCRLFTFLQRLEGRKSNVAEPQFDPGLSRCVSPPSLAGQLVRTLPSALITCPLPPPHCPGNCTCTERPAVTAVEVDCGIQPSEYLLPPELANYHTKLRLLQLPTMELPGHVTVLNLTQVGLKFSPTVKLLNNVRELDLSNNALSDVPMDLLASNMTLHLSGNPFICDCSHKEDVIAIQKYVSKIVDADKVVCSEGDSIWNVDAARLCDVRRAALLGGTLAALGIIAAVIAALTYRYALEIKLFLFSRGWCRSLIREDDLDKGAEYDAFVSFSQEDAKWVAEKLVPILENEHKFKLCVHYRDWVVGDMIPAQIARSVEQSRRTIIVLSKHFLKSTWASLEFHAANVRAQKERRARVLVVVLEDVPEDDMDPELRAYITTNTYLKWGDPWFWEKLRYAMPHRRGLDEVYVNVNAGGKLKRGLNTKLNSEGKIVNECDTTLSSLNSY